MTSVLFVEGFGVCIPEDLTSIRGVYVNVQNAFKTYNARYAGIQFTNGHFKRFKVAFEVRIRTKTNIYKSKCRITL